MKPEIYDAIRKKCYGIFSETLGVVDLITRPNADETLVYVYDKRDGREVHAGSPEKILALLADIETTIVDLKYMGYRVHRIGDQ